MEIKGEVKLLRIFISTSDTFKHALLSEMIVFAAKRYGLAGATVFKGTMGYGSSTIIHSSKFWEITEKLPVIVEIIDETEKITQFLERIMPWFDKISTGCLITVEDIKVILNKPGTKKTR